MDLNNTQKSERPYVTSKGRYLTVAVLLSLTVVSLLSRAVYLHIMQGEFLQWKGEKISDRVLSIPANRGVIRDRYGKQLAASTPVSSVWATPRELLKASEQLPQLAKLLDLSHKKLRQRLIDYKHKGFVYLRRQLPPELGKKVLALGLPGVHLDREYRRYYPASEVMAQVVGYTNISDYGQTGLERAYDKQLSGKPGQKLVRLACCSGTAVASTAETKLAIDGEDINLSIDLRLQSFAYRTLKSAVQKHSAVGGAVVLLDAKTGEILVMVNQPSYNPNDRAQRVGKGVRNRVITDLYEPGSTIKPFTVAAALESGRWVANSKINTAPGVLKVGRKRITEYGNHNYGMIDVATVLRKSSNVGVAKIALAMEKSDLWSILSKVGFNTSALSLLPGEQSGRLRHFSKWSKVGHATHSYGYGMSVTPLQLARAYSIFANDGQLPSLSILRNNNQSFPQQIISADTANAVWGMLQSVVEQGTGKRAAVDGYMVGGKTGTVHKYMNGGYSPDHYLSWFAGVVKTEHRSLVAVVMIDDPQGEKYTGGSVAAPVFGELMTGVMRMLGAMV